ncbi:hypothetical protein ACQP0I_09005 [Micromonospora carbonacea]|uniref:hypothetical protein n=1 Tax=Micromonospora carbonacea TaxID=47853 RepID=UPI003D950E9B
MTVLTTERLVVRDWTAEPGDLARIYDIYSRAEVVRWLGAAPGLPPTDPSGATERIAAWPPNARSWTPAVSAER